MSYPTKHPPQVYIYGRQLAKNILLELDGSDGKIFKVEKEYTIEESKSLSTTLQKMVEYKNKKVQEHIEGVEL
jgi:hypothetical protein